MRENNFDLLRLLAAWGVLFGHAFALYDGRPDPLMAWGYMPVADLSLAVFFVISGFLVTGSWERHQHAGQFALARARRILPGLAVALMVGVLMGACVTTLPLSDYFTDMATWKYLRSILIFPMKYSLPGVFAELPHAGVVNGSLWSLKLEVKCYLVLGGVFLLLPPPFRGRIEEGVMSTLSLVALLWFFTGSKDGQWAFLFFAGATLYYARERVRLDLLAAFLLWGLGIAAWFGGGVGLYVHLLTLPYLVLALAFARGTGDTEKPTRGTDLSYGVYLYAFPVQQLYVYLFGAAWGMAGFIAVTTLVTLAIAWGSWVLVERRFLIRTRPESPNYK